jgi:two-component system, OmpR family, response regulator TctD
MALGTSAALTPTVEVGRWDVAKSVLIVDDEILLCRTLANAVRDAGHRAMTADSAEAAASLLFPRHDFDVVVLDHRLPGETGLELLARMREEGQATPAVLMTAYETASMRSRAFELAVAGFFRKPFNLAELLACIEQVTETEEAARAARTGRANSA